MNINFSPDGSITALYGEEIDLRVLGPLKIERNTSVEFDEAKQVWQVRAESGGVLLFENESRCACIDWEKENF